VIITLHRQYIPKFRRCQHNKITSLKETSICHGRRKYTTCTAIAGRQNPV